MFHRYIELQKEAKRGKTQLAAAWSGLLASEIAQPWDGTSTDGHIPYSDFKSSYSTLRDPFAKAGLYCWGAGTAGAARLQYVGISNRGLGKRFRNRYIAGERSAKGANGARREINLAEKYSEAFLKLKDDFTPLRARVDVLKYREGDIPVAAGLHTRLPRAERYAKLGLDKLWFYLIPAPPASSKIDLEMLERELIRASNAALFRSNDRPLLNVIHARISHKLDLADVELDYVETDEKYKYRSWIGQLW